MEEYVETLKCKYNYNEEMISFLSKLLPALIQYYGEENKEKILTALLNCEIHEQQEYENPKEYLNKYFMNEKEWDLPFLAGAFYHNEISVHGDTISAKPIIYLKTKYLMGCRKFDFGNDDSISILVHEICHLVKGYGKVKLENGKIVDSTGLSREYYEYDSETETLKEIGTDNLGLEEALNSYDEAQVMTIITGIPHECGGYKGMSKVASKLMEDRNLASAIKKSQFNDSVDWIDYLGKEKAEKLSLNFDSWCKSLYFPLEDMFDDEKVKQKHLIMNRAISNINEFITEHFERQIINEYPQGSQEIILKRKREMERQQMELNPQIANFDQVLENAQNNQVK